MDAGDLLLGAVRDARVGARRAVANRLKECLCLLPCCWVPQGVQQCGREVPQPVSLFPVRALRSRPRL